MTTTPVPTFALEDGGAIPALGFGTWQITGNECTQSVLSALEIGYRHIDTAHAYGNHKEIGEALALAGIERQDLFITTKLWRNDLSENAIYAAFDERNDESFLNLLQTDYVDLLLIHWPNSAFPLEQTLGAMMKLKTAGKIKHIGVSNFTIPILEKALEICPEIVTNQVEFHPSLNQKELKQFCDERGVVITAYSPIAQGDDLKIPQIIEIAQKYGVTEAQVILSWVMARGMVVIPKSKSRERISENFESINVQLDESDLNVIDGLNSDHRIIRPGFAPF